MNFFEQQDRAHKNSWLLIALFAAAIVCIIGLTSALIAASFWTLAPSATSYSSGLFSQLNASMLAKTSVAVVAVIACVVIFKRIQLSQGGRSIAEFLGGHPAEQGSKNSSEQQLLNIVEEMAIAAGLPVPPVYVLEETTINAFAAGYNENDAVIGITRGAMERLSRDQIQGVIAHEFSHILHGDMRLNLNLVTILAGILFLSKAGRLALYSTSRARTAQRGGLPLMGLGMGLLVIGSIGTFFGSVIKSAVSRQREYLADASAVQYTRNPDGIAGALKVIGSGVGSNMSSPNASECSHMFFSDAIFIRAFSVFSTHPPIEKRILRIDPQWDGNYLAGKPLRQTAEPPATEAKNKIEQLGDLVQNSGFLDPLMMTIAASLVDSLPQSLSDSTHHPGSAYALMLALRLDKNKHIQEKQLAHIKNQPLLLADVRRYAIETEKLPDQEKLPLIEMSIPALKRLSFQQYQQLKNDLVKFIFADNTSRLQEWLHFRLLNHYLEVHFNQNRKTRLSRRYHSYSQVKNEIIAVISLVASETHGENPGKDAAYMLAANTLNIRDSMRIDSQDLSFHEINKSIEKIDYLVPLLKSEFLTACARCIEHDNQVTANEWGLLRVIAACIGCPMPLINWPE